MQSEYCPLCSNNGAKIRVKAYQLNLQEAVFMCSTDRCTWPVGYHELVFMDRPIGRYWTSDWPAAADKFLADHLKQQRDSLSELSAYTPPHTPGSNVLHDNNATRPSSLIGKLNQPLPASKSDPFDIPVIDCTGNDVPILGSKFLDVPIIDCTSSDTFINEIPVIDCTSNDTIDSENKSFEIPVIDCAGNDTPTSTSKPFDIPVIDFTTDGKLAFQNKIVKTESVSGVKAEKSPYKVLFIKKESCAMKAAFKSDKLSSNTCSKSLILPVNDCTAIKSEKPCFVPENSLTNPNETSVKHRFISRKKPKIINYKKQFDLFEDIKKAKSTNEQSKVKPVVKSCIVHSGKLKPNKIRESLSVDSKSKTNDSINVGKVEPIDNKVISMEPQKELTKEEKILCQSNVTNKIEVVVKKSDPNSLIQFVKGDLDSKLVENVPLEFSNVPCNDYQITQNDVHATMIVSQADIESGKNWTGAESLLAILQDDTLDDILMTTNSTFSESTSNCTLNENDNNKNISKDIEVEVKPTIEDDTLQCTIDDESEYEFLTSLFSPQTNL